MNVPDNQIQIILSQWDKIPVFSLIQPSNVLAAYEGNSAYDGTGVGQNWCTNWSAADTLVPWFNYNKRIFTTDPNYPGFQAAKKTPNLEWESANESNSYVGMVGWVLSPNIPQTMQGNIYGNVIASSNFTVQSKFSEYFIPFYTAEYTVSGEIVGYNDHIEKGCKENKFARYSLQKGDCVYPTSIFGNAASQKYNEYDNDPTENTGFNSDKSTSYKNCKCIADFVCNTVKPQPYDLEIIPGTGSQFTPQGYILSNKFNLGNKFSDFMSNKLSSISRFTGNFKRGIFGDYILPNDISKTIIDTATYKLNTSTPVHGKIQITTKKNKWNFR